VGTEHDALSRWGFAMILESIEGARGLLRRVKPRGGKAMGEWKGRYVTWVEGRGEAARNSDADGDVEALRRGQ
jgi:hypothetical protein